jgi:hypothetical protein
MVSSTLFMGEAACVTNTCESSLCHTNTATLKQDRAWHSNMLSNPSFPYIYRNIGQVLGGHGGMRSISFFTSCILTSSLAIYCRIFTPFYTYSEQQKKDVYLNVNGCYEFWKVSLACPWSPVWCLGVYFVG